MYLWDSNILRHFGENHSTLRAHIERVEWRQIALPSVVIAEVLRGRSEYALKATPAQAPQAHYLLIETIQMLQAFRVIPFDQQCTKVMVEMQQRLKKISLDNDLCSKCKTLIWMQLMSTKFGQTIVVLRACRH